jgi:hypothetical protein
MRRCLWSARPGECGMAGRWTAFDLRLAGGRDVDHVAVPVAVGEPGLALGNLCAEREAPDGPFELVDDLEVPVAVGACGAEGLPVAAVVHELKPFSDSGLRTRAKRIWDDAEMKPIGFHEARHTYASLMIAAGVNAKALTTYMGHRSITTTLDRYGHLFPGNESEAAVLLDAYLEGE